MKITTAKRRPRMKIRGAANRALAHQRFEGISTYTAMPSETVIQSDHSHSTKMTVVPPGTPGAWTIVQRYCYDGLGRSAQPHPVPPAPKRKVHDAVVEFTGALKFYRPGQIANPAAPTVAELLLGTKVPGITMARLVATS